MADITDISDKSNNKPDPPAKKYIPTKPIEIPNNKVIKEKEEELAYSLEQSLKDIQTNNSFKIMAEYFNLNYPN